MPTLEVTETPLTYETREFTIKEVYDALAKNGFEHLRESWFGNTVIEDGQIIPQGGCALGQAALNLGVVAIADAINHAEIPPRDFETIKQYTLFQQLRSIVISSRSKNKWHKHSDEDVTLPDLGTVIIYWNDAKEIPAVFDSLTGAYSYKYTLPTYADVKKMAYEAMKPFFNRKVTLLIASREAGVGIPVAINS